MASFEIPRAWGMGKSQLFVKQCHPNLYGMNMWMTPEHFGTFVGTVRYWKRIHRYLRNGDLALDLPLVDWPGHSPKNRCIRKFPRGLRKWRSGRDLLNIHWCLGRSLHLGILNSLCDNCIHKHLPGWDNRHEAHRDEDLWYIHLYPAMNGNQSRISQGLDHGRSLSRHICNFRWW